jgi:hypothetical protein
MSTETQNQNPHAESGSSPPAHSPLARGPRSQQNLVSWPVCGAPKKRNGEPCQAPGTITTPEGNRCCQHSGRYTAQQRSAWGLRGALTTNRKHLLEKAAELAPEAQDAVLPVLELPDLSDTHAVEKHLALTIARVEAGTLPPSLARVVNELLVTRLKLVELNQAAELLTLETEEAD